MYDNSCNLIYDMIAQRISLKRKITNLDDNNRKKIDSNMLSAICHNRRNPKKNRYLIPESQIAPLMTAFNFNSAKDMFFGNDNEIEAYSFELFRNMILDTLRIKIDDLPEKYKETKKNSISIINTALTDYVPFAIRRLYVRHHIEEDPFIRDFFDEELIELCRNEEEIISTSILHIYNKEDIFYSFDDTLKSFFSEIQTTVKLDKKISDFVDHELSKMLIINDSERNIYSLGNRIYTTLYIAIEDTIHFENTSYYQSREHHSDEYNYHSDIAGCILVAYLNLAKEFNKIQKDNFPIILNPPKWNVEICLSNKNNDAAD